MVGGTSSIELRAIFTGLLKNDFAIPKRSIKLVSNVREPRFTNFVSERHIKESSALTLRILGAPMTSVDDTDSTKPRTVKALNVEVGNNTILFEAKKAFGAAFMNHQLGLPVVKILYPHKLRWNLR